MSSPFSASPTNHVQKGQEGNVDLRRERDKVRPNPRRVVLLVVRDAVLNVGSVWLALFLRFDGRPPPRFVDGLVGMTPIVVLLPIAAGFLRGVYRGLPEYASVGELLRLAEAVFLGSAGALAFARFASPQGHLVPLSVFVIAGPIILLSLGTVRLSHRLASYVRSGRAAAANASRMLIVGAGNAGEMVARDMLRDPGAKWTPVGFVDDDPKKRGHRIHGVTVVGPIRELEAALDKTRADSVLVAMPGAAPHVVRDVLVRVADAGIKAQILPGLGELVGGRVTARDMREVDVADLIGRQPVDINTHEIAGYIQGKSVLVTGAAGSIGSELARQAARFNPSRLVLFDQDESGVYCLAEEIAAIPGGAECLIEIVVGDIRDRPCVNRAFETYSPHVVFHAAARKHVSVMEKYPSEAVTVNVFGTRCVAQAAAEHGAERFVLVSTDKAIKPSSVMGATKRVAELAISYLSAEASTVYAFVRFGNVLGSRGSAVPIFESQIRRGGPITVTDPDASRYFMTIEEAGALIIQAGALARDREAFVLDMGEPVRVLDLAERMRSLLSDRTRPTPEIVFVGLRPGEKMHEELWHAADDIVPSEHERIYRVRNPGARMSPAVFLARVGDLERCAKELRDEDAVRGLLFDLVESAIKDGSDRLISLGESAGVI